MTSVKHKLTYFTLFLAVLALVGTLVNDGIAYPRVLATVDHIIDGMQGVNDPWSFATAAKNLVQYNKLLPENAWIFHLWPPGFIFLEAVILYLFGPNVPIILVLQALACILFAGVMVLEYEFFEPLVGKAAAMVLPPLIFLFPVARIFLIEPSGIIFGETFSIGTFFAGTLLLVRSFQTETLYPACVSGICFAISAYFRSQYESLLLVGFLVATLLCIWQLILVPNASILNRKRRLAIIKPMFVMVLVANCCMAPWRVHNYQDLGSIRWVGTFDVVIKNSLSSKKALLGGGGDFVIEGGGNLACQLEPNFCGESDRSLFFKAFRNNIWEWYKIKFSLLPRYWDSAPSNLSLVKYPPTLYDRIANGIFLFCLIAIFPLLIIVKSHKAWIVLVWINVSFYVGCFVIFSLVQFEVRYFYVVKIFSFTMSEWLLAVLWREWSNVSHTKAQT